VLALGLLLAMVAGVPAAAQTGDSDYARISAPDVTQAAAFLRDVMGCASLDPVRPGASRVLLECAQGSVIEVVAGTAAAADAPAVRLRTERVDGALRWLRQRQVPVLGTRAPDAGSRAGLVHVDVIAPWGQTLELVGPGHLPAADPRSQLASD
jgi:hypothetical protein